MAGVRLHDCRHTLCYSLHSEWSSSGDCSQTIRAYLNTDDRQIYSRKSENAETGVESFLRHFYKHQRAECANTSEGSGTGQLQKGGGAEGIRTMISRKYCLQFKNVFHVVC